MHHLVMERTTHTTNDWKPVQSFSSEEKAQAYIQNNGKKPAGCFKIIRIPHDRTIYK